VLRAFVDTPWGMPAFGPVSEMLEDVRANIFDLSASYRE
jgi:hypothetical protein